MGAWDFAVRHGMHPAYWSSWADVLPVIASRDPAFASALVDTLEGGFARTRSPTVASPRSCFFDGVWICSQGFRSRTKTLVATVGSRGAPLPASPGGRQRGDQAREGSSGSRTRPRPWKQDAAIHVWCRAGVLRPQRQGSEPASLTARARQVVPRSCYFPPAPCPLPCPVCTSTTTGSACISAYVLRWSALLAVAAARAFATSLLSLPLSGAASVDGDPPLLSDLLAEASAPPPLASRMP